MMDRVRTFCLETGHQRFLLRLYDDLSHTLCFFVVVFFVNIFDDVIRVLNTFFTFIYIFNHYFVLLLRFCASVFNMFVIHLFYFCFCNLLFEVSLGFSCLFSILITILLTCWSFVIYVYVSIRYFHNVFHFV
jgi:hypothetical protein